MAYIPLLWYKSGIYFAISKRNIFVIEIRKNGIYSVKSKWLQIIKLQMLNLLHLYGGLIGGGRGWIVCGGKGGGIQYRTS